jgi:hypothetical protein
MRYDVIIIGAGPAGIFAALELVRRDGLRVLLVERGPDIDRRSCPARTTGVCAGCSPCGITCGWGGAGAFSDGKLTLSPEVGGWLDQFMPAERLVELIADVDAVWLEYGATREVHGGGKKVDKIRREALKHGMTLIAAPVRHMGTERAFEILTAMRRELEERLEVRSGVKAERILTSGDAGAAAGDGTGRAGTAGKTGSAGAEAATGGDGAAGRVTGVLLDDGTEVTADHVIVAPGREGARWLVDECHRLGIALRTNPVDIGVRVEVPATIMEPLTSALYESKLVYYTPSFDDPVRTFCMNPHGEVSLENYGDVVTVNGHSYAEVKTDRTNFALLVSTDFTEPFDDPIAYGASIARLANLLGEDIIVQRLGDLQQGHRSTPDRLRRGTVEPSLKGATPGDLSFILPYRHLRDILEMLEAMDALAPGVNARDTLLYGVEVKFYSSRPELDHTLQTPVRGLYAVGDGAGITRGLVQASAAGIIAARAILGGGESAGRGDRANERRRDAAS